MKTDADRVRFAVRFASGNVSGLRPRALNTLRTELAAFLGTTKKGADAPGGFGIRIVNVRPPYPWEYTKAQLFELQEDTRRLLEDTVDGRGLGSTTISDDQALVVGVATVSGKQRGSVGGSVRASFLLTLWLLLLGKNLPPVKKCPECGQLFVRVRRQKYCRDACTDKATWRNYPKEKKRQARQRQYDRHGWTLGKRSGRKTR